MSEKNEEKNLEVKKYRLNNSSNVQVFVNSD
jgi:hypothetical protein